jgi:hypothetical protein
MTDRPNTPSSEFPADFDQVFSVSAEPGNSGFTGLNVLRGLVEGIDDFIAEREQRWRRFRAGPAMLACAPWVDDEELLSRIGGMASCVVMTKQRRSARELERLSRLRAINQSAPGFRVDALLALGGMAPKVDGKPLVVGPGTPLGDGALTAVRTLGYRAGRKPVSMVHAKLALLGHLWWSDEGPLGHVEDVFGFRPLRLWISSANFTRSSRRNLEFGYWTEDPALLKAAQQFLEALISISEDLDSASDTPDPEFAPFEFDDEEMAAYAAEVMSDEDSDEEDLA